MKNPNLGRNAKENNPMWGKHHSNATKKAMSDSQKLRYKAINCMLYKLREDQLTAKVEMVVKKILSECR